MKAKRKNVRAKKERWITTTIFPSLILLTVIFAYFLMNQSSGRNIIEPDLQFKPENANSQFKAAIVDHLSLTFSNQTFMETAADMLVKAGYTVDYFSGEKVTVEFYRNLPLYGYSLIVLRVHSTTGGGHPSVSLFTSEAYTTSKYFYEQLTDKLVPVAYSPEEANIGMGYFGILPSFVGSSMNGKFADTIIVMMGCEGLNNTKMAEAFIQKGAKVYIGWNKSVSATHTDTATITLLHHLISEKQTIKQAVENTMKEVGPDPTHNSVLGYYPVKSGDYVVPCG
jgi:hypothetical protein